MINQPDMRRIPVWMGGAQRIRLCFCSVYVLSVLKRLKRYEKMAVGQLLKVLPIIP